MKSPSRFIAALLCTALITDISMGSLAQISALPAPSVVIFQDIHLNPEAQASLASQLDALIRTSKVGVIGVEGAFSRFDFAPFRSYSEPVRTAVAEANLKQNLIAAPVYVGLTSKHSLPLMIGVDDKRAYERNVAALRAGSTIQSHILAKLAAHQAELTRLKKNTFSTNLFRFDRLRAAYRSDKLSLPVYLRSLARFKPMPSLLARFSAAIRLEKKADVSKIDWRDKDSVTRLTAYLKLAKGIDADRLLDEMTAYEHAIADILVKTEREKTLLTESDIVYLRQKLVRFQLTPAEWASRGLAFRVDELRPFVAFYDAAEKRSARMAENLLANSKPGQTSVLVTGGFHVPDIMKRLREKNISVSIKSPVLKSPASLAKGADYLSYFLRDFLSPSGVAAVTTNEPAAQSTTRRLEKQMADFTTRGIQTPPQTSVVAWGTLWTPPMSVMTRLFGKRWGGLITIFFAGLVQGTLAGAIAIATNGSAAGLIGWVALNLLLHYALGILEWNPFSKQWELKRGFKLSHGPFWRANLISGAAVLAFMLSAAGFSQTIVLMYAAFTPAVINLSSERRIDEVRRVETEELKASFREKMEFMASLHPDKIPTADKLDRLERMLENANPLAALVRFQKDGFRNYKMVMFMQPGSLEESEGIGFKKINDAIGVEFANVFIDIRNRLTWEAVTREFSAISERAGRPVVRKLYDNYKSVTFAVDTDALTEDETRSLNDRLTAISTAMSAAMKTALTVPGDHAGLNNNQLVNAVKRAQALKALPASLDRIPLFWGMSPAGVNNGRGIDDIVLKDAEALAAVNMLRANGRNPDGRGAEFTTEKLVKVLEIFNAEREWLLRHNLLETSSWTDKPVLSETTLEFLRKKPRKTLIAHLSGRGFDAAEAADHLSAYYRSMSPLDVIKPWVGKIEKEEALKLATQTNAALDEIRAWKEDPAALAREWRTGLEPIMAALAKDRRAPFLGSTLGFYGSPKNDPGPDEHLAVLFIDFRGFGGLITNQIEMTASRLYDASRSIQSNPAHFEERLAGEINTLGNGTLDPFITALRMIKYELKSDINYFGGDDIKLTVPHESLYNADGTPRYDVLAKIWTLIPKGMRIRLTLATTKAYASRPDPLLRLALAAKEVDELTKSAKMSEDTWTIGKKRVDQVAVFMDGNGAEWRLPVTGRRLGMPQLLLSPRIEPLPIAVKFLTLARRIIRPLEPKAAAQKWADRTAHDSLLFNGAFVSAIELPLIPGLFIALSFYFTIMSALVISAVLILLFHEVMLNRERLKYEFRKYVGFGQTDRAPLVNYSWKNILPIRLTARLTGLLLILSMAVPQVPILDSATFLRVLFLAFARAYIAHTLWNTFAPHEWRLSLLGGHVAIANPEHPDENQDESFAVEFPEHNMTVIGVMDGYGGPVVGKERSAKAKETFMASLESAMTVLAGSPMDETKIFELLARAGRHADAALPDDEKNGTTVTVTVFWNNTFYTLQGGDSSAFLMTEDDDGNRTAVQLSAHNARQIDMPSESMFFTKADIKPYGVIRMSGDGLPHAASVMTPDELDDVARIELLNGHVVRNPLRGADYFPIIYVRQLPDVQKARLLVATDGVETLSVPELMRITLDADDEQSAVEEIGHQTQERRALIEDVRVAMRNAVRYLERHHSGLFNVRDYRDLNAFVDETNPLTLKSYTIYAYAVRITGALMYNRIPNPEPELKTLVQELMSAVKQPGFIRAKVDDVTIRSKFFDRPALLEAAPLEDEPETDEPILDAVEEEDDIVPLKTADEIEAETDAGKASRESA